MILKDITDLVSKTLRQYNDDVADRLHYVYTLLGLAIYLLFISTNSYIGQPVQCAINNNAELVKYIHSMCYVNGSFHSKNSEIEDMTLDSPINYYQWITLIIIVQCFLLKIPSLLWKYFVYLNGFDIVHVTKNIMRSAYLDEYVENTNWLKTERKIESISDHLRMTFLNQKTIVTDRLNLSLKRRTGDISSSSGGGAKAMHADEKTAARRRDYPRLRTRAVFPLFVPYMLTKLAYLLVVVLQFSYLSWMFGFSYLHFGVHATQLYMSANSNSNSNANEYGSDRYLLDMHYFPKRAYCEVRLNSKKFENVGTYLCSLPLNMFNQVFYIGFWYWLLLLALVSTLSVAYWLRLCVRAQRRRYVLSALQLDQHSYQTMSYTAAYYLGEETSSSIVDSFLVEKTGMTLMENFDLFFQDVCSLDVIFCVQLIAINSHALAARDLLNNLWYHYLDLDELRIKDITSRPLMQLKRPVDWSRAPLANVSEESETSSQPQRK